MKRWSVFGTLVLLVLFTRGQRTYIGSSVLSTGQWTRLSTTDPGVYRIDAAQLRAAGFPQRVPSQQLRLFGFSGGELPEDNKSPVQDDLSEVSIEIFDGGDGSIDGNDYLLFFASGADEWVPDPATGMLRFRKNHYTRKTYFYLQLASISGKRIQSHPEQNNPTRQVSAFYEPYRYELDSISFLKSGKEWFGEDFSNQPGRRSSREFNIPFTVVPGQPVKVISDVAGRGFGQVNRLPVTLNGAPLLEHQTLPLVGNLLEPAANPSRQEGQLTPNATALRLNYVFSGSGVNAEAWLNWFEVHATRRLSMQGTTRLIFRDTSKTTAGVVTAYLLADPAPDTRIWDITHPLDPRRVTTQPGNPLRFVLVNTGENEFIAFDPAQLPKAIVEGPIANQDLHGSTAQDMVIVTDPVLLSQAARLADFHRQRDGLRVLVVEPEKIYHEFSGGRPDPSAIRNFMKMLYDKAGGDQTQRPRFLLLMGGASHVQMDFRASGKNRVPSYQSLSSLDPLTSYVTDDYFGFLDDNEDINRNLPSPQLDLGIGRISARSLAGATMAVDKILRYHTASAMGSWRNNMTLVADDEDFNIHVNDAEQHADLVSSYGSSWNIKKIYLDAFEQEGSTAGSIYPQVNQTISRNINAGTLIWNYSGHGGSSRLAQESILDRNSAAGWTNTDRLPLFITATCDFAPFDDPSQVSIGEELLMARPNGAVGLLTTTRLVFASSNRIINSNFLNALLKKDNRGRVPALGEALLQSKNFTVVNSGDFINARKFILLGDPAMKPAIPEYQVVTRSINGKPTASVPDTLRALGTYEITGSVLKPDGSPAADFNGDVFPQVYDKPKLISTRGNDPQSRVVNFLSSEILLYNGKVKAVNGQFSFRFIAPKDMDPVIGSGRISYYASNGIIDAAGGTNNLLVGGQASATISDQQGPLIKGYLDTAIFRNGDPVKQEPMLYIELSDVSGINLTGGLGHEIIVVVDEDPRKTYVLNDLFIPTSGNQSGTILFRLPALSEGKHTLRIRAWDVFNNSSSYKIDCVVRINRAVNINTLRTIPNPVSGQAIFSISMDGPTQGAMLQLDLFTIGGQSVRSFSHTINEPALRFKELMWDGRDERGNALGSGLYVFILRIKTKDGVWTQKQGRLVVLSP